MDFEIIDYTEKSIAIFGDTRSIKDDLKALGGRFNPRLNYNGGKAAGWIFPIDMRDQIEELLEMSDEDTDTEVTFEIDKNEKHPDSDANVLPKCIKCMNFQKAIVSVINDYGKDILLKSTVINILSDYNAFQESKAFKVILKHIISEGFLDQIQYIKNWETSHPQLINRFVENTGFQYDKSLYVVSSLAYALGISQTTASYNISNPQQLASPQPVVNHTPTKISHSSLNLTMMKLNKLSEEKKIQYKEKAEQYIESIIEYEGDIKKELGVDVVISCKFDYNFNWFDIFLDINGVLKNEIYFCFTIYNNIGKILHKSCTKAKKNKKNQILTNRRSFQEDHKTVGNISKIVITWDKEYIY